jgi:hypothetical protein
MPLEKIKIVIATIIIIAIYLFVAGLLFKEQVDQRANLYECPLCGQLVK